VALLAAAVARVQVRADRAEPKFQEFQCNDAGQVPALFFCVALIDAATRAPEPIPAYCGTTAWNIDFAANSMSSATL
jgi:hypothetical protein